MSFSKFKIDNKELLRALGIAQTTRSRDQHSFVNQQDSALQDSESVFEMTKHDNYSINTSSSVLKEDRGQFLFALDIDISDGQKDSLMVYAKDNPYDLAKLFCQKHEIEDEIADIIAVQIVEHAKAAFLNKENNIEEAQSTDVPNREEYCITSENWVQPKGGDDSVEEILSPYNNGKADFMPEIDMNTEFEEKRQAKYAKNDQSCEFLTSARGETTSRFDNSTKDIKKSDSFIASVFTENTFSPTRSYSKKTTDRFYEKTLRDIENRTRNEAYIGEIHNQEKYKECTFHPNINQRSLQLVKNQRRDLSTESLLLLKGKITEERRMIIKQNLRAKENDKNTFRPEINNKSKHINGNNKQNCENRERFEDLYQEYKIFHEKRNQLKSKLNKEYSFTPNICQNYKDQDQSSFFERLDADIRKRNARKIVVEENQKEQLPTFCPKIIKTISDDSRNIDKLPIGEYLYKMSDQIKEKQADLRESADRKMRAKTSKCTEKSSKIVKTTIKKNLKTVFENLDADKDGLISAECLEALPKMLMKTLVPLAEELRQANSKLNSDQFIEKSEKLLKAADPTVKSYLMIEIAKKGSCEKKAPYEALVFHPKIDKKSKEIAETSEERQGRSVYQRLHSEKAKSEVRLKELRDKSASDELRECSFYPVINQNSVCTESFYQKMFAQADRF